MENLVEDRRNKLAQYFWILTFPPSDKYGMLFSLAAFQFLTDVKTFLEKSFNWLFSVQLKLGRLF